MMITMICILLLCAASVLLMLHLVRTVKLATPREAPGDNGRDTARHIKKLCDEVVKESSERYASFEKWRSQYLAPVQENNELRKQLDALTTTLHASQMEVGRVIQQRDTCIRERDDARALLDGYRVAFQCNRSRRPCSYARKVPA
jgi:hypothetical protein